MAADDRKVLRVGIIQNGQLIEERLLRKRAAVSLGRSPRNTFVLADAGLPSSLTLFDVRDGTYHLVFRPGLNGKLYVDGSVLDFRALREQKLAHRDGDTYRVPLGAHSRGKVVAGDVTVLFQFVTPPPRPTPAELPAAFRSSVLRFFDWPFVVALLGSFLVQVFPVVFIVGRDYPEPPGGLESLDDRFVSMILEAKPPEEKPLEEEKPKEKDKEKEKEKRPEPKPKPKPKPEPRTPEEVAERKAVEMRRMQRTVRKKTILSVIGSEGEGPGSIINTLRDDATSLAIAEAFDGTGGVEIAGDDLGLRDVGGETGDVAALDADALRTSTERKAVTTGKKEPEARIRGSVAARGADEVYGTGALDQAKISSVVRRRLGALNGCYEKQLKRNPELAGKVRVRFTILESGRVGDPTVVENTLGDAEIGRCIIARMGGWRFPRPDGGTVTLTLPFTFEPSG